MPNRYYVWCDGTCQPINPGGAFGLGFVIKIGDLTTDGLGSLRYLSSGAAYMPPDTESTDFGAEFAAMAMALKALREFYEPPLPVIVHSDCQMLVRKMADPRNSTSGGGKYGWARDFAVTLRESFPHVGVCKIERVENLATPIAQSALHMFNVPVYLSGNYLRFRQGPSVRGWMQRVTAGMGHNEEAFRIQLPNNEERQGGAAGLRLYGEA